MKSKKLISAVLLLAVAGTGVSGITLAACKEKTPAKSTRTIYVTATASRDGAGTKEDPRALSATIGGNEFLRPGDTVLVEPGVYNFNSRIEVFNGGEYNNYVTIKNADPTSEKNDGKVTLSFYEMDFASTNRGVQIYGNYIHWDGIDICGAGDNGMYIGGSYNIIENSEFYDNRDTGLQLGRSYSPSGDMYEEYDDIESWPSYNLIKNCTSYNNYDNETYGENADGFAAKLTVGFGNIFDGCIAYRNSDDGWDLYAKTDSGNIGAVIMYNCVAFENGYILETQAEFNDKFPNFNTAKAELHTDQYSTRDGDGNGFKLGGSIMEGEVFLKNCLSFNNRMHGVTDNSNPGVISIDGVTSYNNGAGIDNTDGSIAYVGNNVNEGSGNIDLARQKFSYNHVANVLSINDGNYYISSDEYRGTVQNSTFQAMDGTMDKTAAAKIQYSVEGQDEYNTKTKDYGTKTTVLQATDVFKELPTLRLGFDKTLHKKWRNADGSINLGDLMALKDASGTQGSKLNLSSWDEYEHFPFSDLTKCKSQNEADAQAVIDMTYLPINQQACYQNFYVVTKIKSTEISWASNNSGVLKVTDIGKDTNSGYMCALVEVIRPTDGDKQVTLTATVKVGKVTKTKTFNITVKKNTFRVGEFEIDSLDGDAIIIDKQENWFNFQPSKPVIINGTSDSHVAIDESYYDRLITVKFATVADPNFNNPSHYTNESRFEADRPGIWQVSETITFKEGVALGKAENGNGLADQVVTKDYRIYVADRGANVDFMSGESSLAVNKNGYTLTGNFTSPTGTIYSISLPTSASKPTAAEIKANENTEKYEFRATGSTFQFTQANSEAYKVYYFLENVNGTIQSDVYEKAVNTVNITTKTEFQNMLTSNNTSTVYLLQNDIDFGGSVATTDTDFKGVFNGMGHKLHNITINNTSKGTYTGLFRRVAGGTIMNVTFENISVTDKTGGERTGIIGQMKGGYISNVRVHNVKVDGSIRVGGLIGQVFAESKQSATAYIDRVEIINDKAATEGEKPEYYLHGDRAGGVVGYVQAGSADGYNLLYMTNCYVDVYIETNGNYGGGIVGRYDDRCVSDVLEITNCVFFGEIHSEKYVGGILGGFSGAGKLIIVNCVSYGTFYYAKDQYQVFGAEKNCSNIIGYYASNGDATVKNCYAPFAEHNGDYQVTAFHIDNLSRASLWRNDLTSYTEDREQSDGIKLHFSAQFDYEGVWELLVNPENDRQILSPYVKLK